MTMKRSRWPQPDFMPAPQRPGVLMWLWLAVSFGVLLALGLHLLDQRSQARGLDEQQALLQRLVEQAGPRPGATPASAPAPEVQRRAWAVAEQLSVDWRGRWLALEQALPPGLHLQALEMDGAQDLRIEGLAAELAPVTQLADRLAVQSREREEMRGSQVELTRLQRSDESQPLRFELVRRRAGPRQAS